MAHQIPRATASRRDFLTTAFSLPLLTLPGIQTLIGDSVIPRPEPPLLIFNSAGHEDGFARDLWFRLQLPRTWEGPRSYDYVGSGVRSWDMRKYNQNVDDYKKIHVAVTIEDEAEYWWGALTCHRQNIRMSHTVTGGHQHHPEHHPEHNHAVRILDDVIARERIPRSLILELISTALRTGKSSLFKRPKNNG